MSFVKNLSDALEEQQADIEQVAQAYCNLAQQLERDLETERETMAHWRKRAESFEEEAWLRVADIEPAEVGWYLGSFDGDLRTCFFLGKPTRHMDGTMRKWTACWKEPTHWMPLPSAPSINGPSTGESPTASQQRGEGPPPTESEWGPYDRQ